MLINIVSEKFISYYINSFFRKNNRNSNNSQIIREIHIFINRFI